MTPMAPTRPIRPPEPTTTTTTDAAAGPTGANGADAGVRLCRVVRLASRLSAVAAARTEVEAAIGAWCTAVDPDVAILLTSELVTNAVTHASRNPNRRAGARGMRGEAVLLVIAAATSSRASATADRRDASRTTRLMRVLSLARSTV